MTREDIENAIREAYQTQTASVYNNSTITFFKNTIHTIYRFSPPTALAILTLLFFKPNKKEQRDNSKKLFNSVVKQGFIDLQTNTSSKKIRFYQWGNAKKKMLLIHGWSSRATDLAKMIQHFIDAGYEVTSFDLPAHGLSSGYQTNVMELIASIDEMNHQFGPFDAAAAHSFGGLCLVNAVKRGLSIPTVITINSGAFIHGVFEQFCRIFALTDDMSDRLKKRVEERIGTNSSMWIELASYENCHLLEDKNLLLIHDQDDYQVLPIETDCFAKALPSAEVLRTHKLGHNKILGNDDLLKKIVDFVKKTEQY